LVRALKRVLLPTLGRPTIPMLRLTTHQDSARRENVLFLVMIHRYPTVAPAAGYP
jgi:hypothetical protein